MTIVKRVLLLFATLLILANVVGLFVSREQWTTVQYAMPATPEQIFPYLVQPDLVVSWIWPTRQDPSVNTLVFAPNTIDSGFTWSGAIAGNGEWNIEQMHAPNSIAVRITSAHDAITMMNVALIQQGKQTLVTCRLLHDRGAIPMVRLFTPSYNHQLAVDAAKSLQTLARMVSHRYAVRITGITQQLRKPMHIISVSNACVETLLGQAIAQSFATLGVFVINKKVNLSANQRPMLIFNRQHTANPTIEFEAALQTESLVLSDTTVKSRTIPMGWYVVVEYNGPYESLDSARTVARHYASTNNIKLTDQEIDVFETDPKANPHQKDWVTTLYFGIHTLNGK